MLANLSKAISTSSTGKNEKSTGGAEVAALRARVEELLLTNEELQAAVCARHARRQSAIHPIIVRHASFPVLRSTIITKMVPIRPSASLRSSNQIDLVLAGLMLLPLIPTVVMNASMYVNAPSRLLPVAWCCHASPVLPACCYAQWAGYYARVPEQIQTCQPAHGPVFPGMGTAVLCPQWLHLTLLQV